MRIVDHVEGGLLGGCDDLRAVAGPKPHPEADGEVRETVISLGKQLSRRWYVGYERGLNATEGSWQLIYRIARRFTLRAQSGLENSLDLIWVWRLDGEEPMPKPMPKSPAAVPP